MTWTTDMPTKPGWYWWRRSDEEHAALISNAKVIEVFEYGVDNTLYSTYGFVSQLDGEWAGPLEPPT